MKLNPVNSSNISGIGYEGTTLYVKFNDGSLYAYYRVPEIVYKNLMSADSHGKFLAAHVKNIYHYERIS